MRPHSPPKAIIDCKMLNCAIRGQYHQLTTDIEARTPILARSRNNNQHSQQMYMIKFTFDVNWAHSTKIAMCHILCCDEYDRLKRKK
jgi:hypothetical protein